MGGGRLRRGPERLSMGDGLPDDPQRRLSAHEASRTVAECWGLGWMVLKMHILSKHVFLKSCGMFLIFRFGVGEKDISQTFEFVKSSILNVGTLA